MYSFYRIISRAVLHGMTNISDRRCRENQNTHFIFNNLFLFKQKQCPLQDNVEKYCTAGQATDKNMRMRTAYVSLQIHTGNM